MNETSFSNKFIIVGSSPEAVNFKPLDGYKIVAVNNAITLTKEHTDFWFTLDPSEDNLLIMKTKPYQCKYYAAIPDDFGTMKSKVRRYKRPKPLGVNYLKRVSGDGPWDCHYGLRENRNEIATGNSGYGALNLVYHFNPIEIILLGFSGDNTGKFDGRKTRDLSHLPKLFESAKFQLDQRGVVVYNANRQSEITCFTNKPFDEFV